MSLGNLTPEGQGHFHPVDQWQTQKKTKKKRLKGATIVVCLFCTCMFWPQLVLFYCKASVCLLVFVCFLANYCCWTSCARVIRQENVNGLPQFMTGEETYASLGRLPSLSSNSDLCLTAWKSDLGQQRLYVHIAGDKREHHTVECICKCSIIVSVSCLSKSC